MLYKKVGTAQEDTMFAKKTPETFVGRLYQHATAHQLAKRQHKKAPLPDMKTEELLLSQKLAPLMKSRNELVGLYVVFAADDGSRVSGIIYHFDQFTLRMKVRLDVTGITMTCRPSMIWLLHEK